MDGGQKDSLPKIFHTYPTMMKPGAVIPYLKKIQKIYESRDTRNQEIPIQIPFWYIISDSFNLFCVFKFYFDKRGYNLDDVSKNCYSRPS